MTYLFLQHYWCFIVSLLGALLVFLLFVQGANSVAGSLGGSDEGRRLVYNSTGRKWEFTFTTLVTFGGAFFASFPLFYSTSFGGAYWLWMIILFTFVLQAVSYEFQNKIGNFLGPKTFQFFLTLNGIVGPLLLGGAVATFFEGSNFIVEKNNLVDIQAVTPVISRWANASHGLDALLNPWVLVFGFAVVFLARVLGILYVMNNVNDAEIRSRGRLRLLGAAVPFLVLFVAYLVHLMLKEGFAVNPDTGVVFMEPYKYFNNFIDMWYLLIVLLVGVLLVLYGIYSGFMSSQPSAAGSPATGSPSVSPAASPAAASPSAASPAASPSASPAGLTPSKAIWPAGIGTVLTVLALLLCSAWNNTAYYPSTADLQSSLTLQNSCSSEFTLRTMFYVSLLVPFVLAYIVYAWRAIDSKKLDREELHGDHAY